MKRNKWTRTATMIAVGSALALAAGTGTAVGAAIGMAAATAPQGNTAAEAEASYFPLWPDWRWEASDIVPGAPMEAAHVRDLRNAVEHLLSRDLQSGRRPTRCGARLAGYLVGGAGIHAYVENNPVPRSEWTEENLRTYQQQLHEEQEIRVACLGHPRQDQPAGENTQPDR